MKWQPQFLCRCWPTGIKVELFSAVSHTVTDKLIMYPHCDHVWVFPFFFLCMFWFRFIAMNTKRKKKFKYNYVLHFSRTHELIWMNGCIDLWFVVRMSPCKLKCYKVFNMLKWFPVVVWQRVHSSRLHKLKATERKKKEQSSKSQWFKCLVMLYNLKYWIS